MFRLYCLGVLSLFLSGCASTSNSGDQALKTGIWRATLKYDEATLPFNFQVKEDSAGGYDIIVMNARERLLLDEVFIDRDSVNIPLHIFDASIRTVRRGDSLVGVFVKHYDAANKIPFVAVHGQDFRFAGKTADSPVRDFSGKYRVEFYNPKDTTHAIGVFLQKDDSVTGTFLTATGDYRYLQGNVINDTMHLSAFDGNHAYLFKAVFSATNQLDGVFYSGKQSKKSWTGVKDDAAALPDAESMTFLKPGYDRITFNFPDPNGKPVSPDDLKYKNKVLILQIFGTWCPNCMDETRFLTSWYNENRHRGVEIIGLAYERHDDFKYASDRVKRMTSKLNVPYDFVIAGTNDKLKASESLPMLNRIVSFPTTIFIARDGTVKKIHTGFSGPGTGVYYEEFIQDFNATMDELLEQPVN